MCGREPPHDRTGANVPERLLPLSVLTNAAASVVQARKQPSIACKEVLIKELFQHPE